MVLTTLIRWSPKSRMSSAGCSPSGLASLMGWSGESETWDGISDGRVGGNAGNELKWIRDTRGILGCYHSPLKSEQTQVEF